MNCFTHLSVLSCQILYRNIFTVNTVRNRMSLNVKKLYQLVAPKHFVTIITESQCSFVKQLKPDMYICIVKLLEYVRLLFFPFSHMSLKV